MPIIGKKLLNTLMFEMYHEHKSIYREYIQNSSDSIKKAVQLGILEKLSDGQISIVIDANSRSIEITDNGTGIPVGDAEKRLLNIADSKKDGVTQAGQFGIGRLVGAGYCDELTFETSSHGEDKSTTVVFDVKKAHSIIEDKSDQSTAEKVIERITTVTIKDATSDEHYFKVRMSGVNEAYRELLNENVIYNYLVSMAPVEFDMTFKQQLFMCNIPEEYKERYDNISTYRISLNNYVDIRKPYKLKIDGTNDEIDSIRFFTIKDNSEELAWGWYAMTKFTKAIPESDAKRGIRLRRHNILVGSSTYLDDCFKEKRGNTYFYGEIHATHPKLQLSSSRDGLATTPTAAVFKAKLKEFFTTLSDVYNVANDAKNALKPAEAAILVVEAKRTYDPNQVLPQINTATEVFGKVKKSRRAQSAEAKAVIDVYQKVLQHAVDICKNLQGESTDTQTTTDVESAQGNDSQPEVKKEPKAKPKDIKTTGTPTVLGPVEQSDPVDPNDPFSPIINQYSPETIETLRKVFSLMYENCGTKANALIAFIQKRILKELEK